MAKAPAQSVPEYIKAAPETHRPALEDLRELIRGAMPAAVETMSPNGFPVYTDAEGNWLAGFAWRAKGPVLYVMAPGVLDRHEGELGVLRSGKSCVEWRASRAMTLEGLRELAERMLSEAAAP